MITFWSLVIEHQYHYWLTELSRLQAASVSPLDLPTVGTNAPYEGPSMGGGRWASFCQAHPVLWLGGHSGSMCSSF